MKRHQRVLAAPVIVTLALVATLLMAGTASAHVLVQPRALPKGASDVIFSFSTPNETDNTNVTQLEIDFPTDHPLLSAYAQTLAGWTANVVTTKLAKPVTTDDGQITEAVSQITWTTTGDGIPPHQFGLFTVSVGQLPSNTKSLVFKALQTYSDGTVVRWIEVPVKGAPAALALLALAAAEPAPLLGAEISHDVGGSGVHDVLGCVEQRGDVIALGLGLRHVVALLERADLPAGVDHPAREARAVVGAAPRRLGREVDAALPHDLTRWPYVRLS